MQLESVSSSSFSVNGSLLLDDNLFSFLFFFYFSKGYIVWFGCLPLFELIL
jgi:hypothetical protein